MINWETKKIDIKNLQPVDNNPRKITEKQLKRLAKSIDDQGLFKPLIVDTKGNILAGNQRYQVLQAKNIKKVEVTSPDRELTEDEKKRIIILDNDHNGEFDIDILTSDFTDIIKDLEINIDLPTLEPEVTEDEYEEPQEKNIHNVKRGDIWQLGEHRLMCGDSTMVDDVKKLMDGEKADMVFTDPPYNTGMTAHTQKGVGDTLWKGNRKTEKARLSHMFNDDYTDVEWQDFMNAFISNYSLLLKEDSVAYVFLDWRRSYQLIPHIKEYFNLSNVIVWDKVVHGLGSDYKYTYELIHVCKKGNPKMDTHQGDREYSDIWHIQRKMGKDEDHATKKPIELCERGIRHASKKTDLVVDLFGGSGTTLIACEQLDRKCYMMELDEHYCSVIIDRWQKLTNKKAKRIKK